MLKKKSRIVPLMKEVLSFAVNAWNGAIDFIYPPRCSFCDKILSKMDGAGGACKNCQKNLVYITKEKCLKCGKQLDNAGMEFCYDCRRVKHSYNQARSVFVYEKQTKESLYRFKKDNRKEYAEFFGREICRMLGRWIYNCKGDLLVPIPVHEKTEKERGYNQSLLLAKEISKQTRIPVCEGLLLKTADTRSQKNLSRKERKHNLEKAFSVAAEGCEYVRGKKIILVDDIYTTGATVDAAAKVLKAAGATEVFVVTVAVGGQGN